MLTKGAFGNLVNRYRAVLKKCNLINTFGSLAVASMLVLGGAGVASAAEGNLVYSAETEVADVITESAINGGYAADQRGVIVINSAPVNFKSTVYIQAEGSQLKEAYSQANPSVTGIRINESAVTFAKGVEVNAEDTENVQTVGIFITNNDNNSSQKITAFKEAVSSATTSARGEAYAMAVSAGNVKADMQGASVTLTATSSNSNAYALSAANAVAATSKNTVAMLKATANNGIATGIEVAGGDVSFAGPTTIEATGKDAYGINAFSYNGITPKFSLTGNTNTITATSTVTDGKAFAVYMEGGTGVIGSSSSTSTLNGDVYVANGATLTLNGTTTITGDVSADSSSTLTLNLGGESTIDGALDGDVAVNLNSGDAALTVGSSSGTVTVSGSGAANDAVGGSKDALLAKVTVNGAQVDDSAFAGMEEGFLYGAVDENGEAAKPNTAIEDTLEVAHAAPLALGRVVMNDVRKRMGDLRDSKEESGVWMRWDGGKLAGSEGQTNNFNTIQIGGDKKFGKNCRFGVAGAFTHGDIDHTNGSGEMETFSFSAYGTWMGDNGMFADVIARVGFTNTDLTMKGNTVSLDNEALSLSAEYGWRFDMCKQFYVEPQVELTYTYLTSADAKVSYADYSVDSLDSLIGRAGLLAGWKLPDDMGSVYARASVVQEFLGDSKLTASAFGNTIAHSVDGQDTWVEYGLGANVKLNDKTYIWADVERTAGADLDEEWRGTVGLRYSF